MARLNVEGKPSKYVEYALFGMETDPFTTFTSHLKLLLNLIQIALMIQKNLEQELFSPFGYYSTRQIVCFIYTTVLIHPLEGGIINATR